MSSDHKTPLTVAHGNTYFGKTGFPITVGRANSETNSKNPGPLDLTETEHVHDFSELTIVTRGTGHHCLEGDDFPVAAGDIFLLQGHQRHYFRQRRDFEHITIMYDPERLNLPESELRKLPGYCALFLLEPQHRRYHDFASRLHLKRMELARVEQLVSDMEQEIQEQDEGFEAVLFNKLLEIIIYLSRRYLQAETTEAQALLRVGKVIGVLESDYARNWTIQDLLEISHMSRTSFMQTFRQATGQPPIEYLIRLRIQAAMDLLRRTEWPITEIAAEVGFQDSNYFSRQFKKIQHQSPSQYRHTHHQE